MRRAVLTLPLVLLLTLVGCSEDASRSDNEGSEGRAGDPCGTLTEDDVSALVGVPVTAEGEDVPGGSTCTFSDDQGDGLLTVLVVDGSDSLDPFLEPATGTGGEASVEDLEIDGADQAALLDDTASGIAATQVLALVDGRVYTVYPTGLTRDDEERIGLAATRILAGGELDAADRVERADVPHPCAIVTAAEARTVLGGSTAATRADATAGTVAQCVYEAAGVEASLVDVGHTVRVDNLAATAGGQRGREVASPPLTVVEEPTDPGGPSRFYAATDRTVVSIEVDAGDPARSRRIALDLLALVP